MYHNNSKPAPAGSNIWTSVMSESGSWLDDSSLTGVNPLSSTVQVRSNTVIEFEDGLTVTAGQLETYLKILHKLALKEFPEDLV